ncbi:MAG: Gfo/Idh/MocA family protein [Gammaproteobacteria bacterium]
MKHSKLWNRRRFLQTSAAAGFVLGTRLTPPRALGANDRIRIGIIGTGGRARGLMNLLKSLPGNQMVAVCDVYEPRQLQAQEIAGGAARHIEYRQILDNKEIDAVLIGTPDHWHKQMTLDAVAAGKDVYVEKPVSHSIEEGAEMVRVIESSKQLVQTGTQQRSWEHWILGKQLVDLGKVGQITFIQTYWYQHPRAGSYPDVDMSKLDWKRWLGPAPNQPYRPERFFQWRHFWDFGGGVLTDLLTHWIDVVQWYMGTPAPLTAVTTAHNYSIKIWELPDTVTATLEFPKDFMVTHTGTYVSRIDDGGLEFRGDKGTLKIDRDRLAFYNEDSRNLPGTPTPEPEILVKSVGDGTRTHLQNWLDCIRSRKSPSANIRVAHGAARTSHIANLAMKMNRRVRWNDSTQKVE